MNAKFYNKFGAWKMREKKTDYFHKERCRIASDEVTTPTVVCNLCLCIYLNLCEYWIRLWIAQASRGIDKSCFFCQWTCHSRFTVYGLLFNWIMSTTIFFLSIWKSCIHIIDCWVYMAVLNLSTMVRKLVYQPKQYSLPDCMRIYQFSSIPFSSSENIVKLEQLYLYSNFSLIKYSLVCSFAICRVCSSKNLIQEQQIKQSLKFIFREEQASKLEEMDVWIFDVEIDGRLVVAVRTNAKAEK